SDLEEKGYLYHPHTSAGRVPTDVAYRLYVDSLMRVAPIASPDREKLAEQLSASGGSTIEAILRRAAQSLSVLTQELGMAVGPRLDQIVLQRLELVRLSSERLVLVLSLQGGAVRQIFVEVGERIADNAVAEVSVVLNERLGGLTLREIRASLAARLRDANPGSNTRELLNIFVQERDSIFDDPLRRDESLVLGQTSVLADQPEFASSDQMRRLLALTESNEHLTELLRRRHINPGLSITIGNEHGDPRFENFTIVTSEYRAGSLAGVIGVIGPTRMPYEKVIAVVTHASRLVSDLLD
ncbi:MAG TPA: heat-inducible transcriptional repressor HrcA, partial [Gemmatimonadaceae bacterium]